MRIQGDPGRGLVRGGRRASARARRGFTMLEVGLAITILVVAILAMSASTVRMHHLRRQNRERTLGQNAVRTMVERIHSLSQERLTASSATWAPDVVAALSAGGALGDTFTVRELDPQAGQATVGTIEVITDETTTDAAVGFDLGLPRDLNGDGLSSNADVSATARLLPVIVRARWKGIRGDVEIAHPFYVTGF